MDLDVGTSESAIESEKGGKGEIWIGFGLWIVLCCLLPFLVDEGWIDGALEAMVSVLHGWVDTCWMVCWVYEGHWDLWLVRQRCLSGLV
ncbi:hypothetical protein ES702_02591 [subsurface metagenome]